MNSIPLYKQIIEDILSRIHDGSLQPGDRIPSERELAEQYLVSHITSKNALAELADKGYITRQKGKGSSSRALRPLNSNSPSRRSWPARCSARPPNSRSARTTPSASTISSTA